MLQRSPVPFFGESSEKDAIAMAEKQTLIAIHDDKTKQPASLVTRCNLVMKIMKGKEVKTGKPWKIQSINKSNYECNNVEVAFSPSTALFKLKLAKGARQMTLYYRNGKEPQETIQGDFALAMILKEQNYYSNQDMMEYHAMDHTKTQEYMKSNGDQPKMKANNIHEAKSASKESELTEHAVESLVLLGLVDYR